VHKFARNFITEWRRLKLPFENANVLIAVSGGADSAALALVLADLKQAKKLKLSFAIAHFNHNLRDAESDADEKFVKDLAEKIEFKFVSNIQNPKSKIRNQKGNLEQNARDSRYEFLFETAQKENALMVLTAHTVNDQAETFLLNLLRGSGLRGMGAMKSIRNLESENEDSAKPEILLVRPFLSWAKRSDTEDFVREKGIDFRQDSMNRDEKFSRVKIRKKLIPLLREFNPKIVETLARTAFLLQDDLEEKSKVRNLKSESLSVKELQNLSQTKLYAELRNWLKDMRGSLRQIGLQHIQAVERLIVSRKSGRKIELPGGAAVIKKDGRLCFEKTKVEKSPTDN
jgi:tRNA(Ile)-lysidine synthase